MFRFSLFLLLSSTMLPAATSQSTQFRRPLVFEPNRGQASAHVKWLARGPGYELALTATGITMTFPDSAGEGKSKYSTLRMKLEGGQPWEHWSGLEPTGGVSNYLRSGDVKDSLTGIPHYGRITVGSVYDGVDLVFYSRDGALEYDFVLKAGVDPKMIHLAFEGQRGISVDAVSGDVVLTTDSGKEVRQLCPNVYQQVGTKRVPVAGKYELSSGGRVGFALSAYDRRIPLVIDPTVTFVQTFGSWEGENVYASAVDQNGQMYVAGGTFGADFPVSNGSAFQVPAVTCFDSSASFCVRVVTNGFVITINTVGVVLFSTFIGPGPGSANGIAVESTGVYVTGDYELPKSSTQIIGYGGGVSAGAPLLTLALASIAAVNTS